MSAHTPAPRTSDQVAAAAQLCGMLEAILSERDALRIQNAELIEAGLAAVQAMRHSNCCSLHQDHLAEVIAEEAPQVINGIPFSLLTQADYARARLCVNACEGMADPATEIVTLRQVADGAPEVRSEYAKLRAQNAELLAALEWARAVLEETNKVKPYGGNGYACIQKARAAIAKAQGGAT